MFGGLFERAQGDGSDDGDSGGDGDDNRALPERPLWFAVRTLIAQPGSTLS